MSKVVEWFLLPLFFVLSILYAFNSLGNIIELKKAFHHINNDDSYPECGNMVLYFSHDPHIKKIEDEAKAPHNKAQQSFFFPCSIAGECEAMIQRVNQSNNNFYTCTVEKMETPEQGVKVLFSYDPEKVTLSYEQFDAIGLQKGVVFHCYNKECIATLQEKSNKPLLRILSNTKKPCIVIDSGHGGGDSGAMGCNGTIAEKTICLAIGSTVAQLLNDHGCSVLLTRNNDTNVFLDERTSYANHHKADLFVSIHANYAGNSQSHGVETFCLKQQLFTEYFSLLSEDEKKKTVASVMQKHDFSYKLAQSIQQHICSSDYCQEQRKQKPHDRKVRFSVAQVLLGTQMPAVLVEVGFLSHPEEVRLLSDVQYQKFLAQRIVDGIIAVLPA